MISMRYHIISLAAVFLALALGIVLGATKISSPLITGLESDNADLTSSTTSCSAKQELTDHVADDQKIAEAVWEVSVRGILPSPTVVLITTATPTRPTATPCSRCSTGPASR